MFFRRLIAVLCCALPLLLVTPTAEAALATRSISLVASPTTVVAGQAVKFTGTATGVKPGSSLQLQVKAGSTWKTVSSVKLPSTRKFSFRTKPPAGQPAYRVYQAKQLGQASLASPVRTLTVLTPTTLLASATQTTGQSALTISGTASPSHDGSSVTIEQLVGSAWTALGTATVTGSAFSLSQPVDSDTPTLRVVKARDGLYAAATSATMTPSLTRTGALTVTVLGVPSGQIPSITLTGPSGSQPITGDTTLAHAAPGQWSLAASPLAMSTRTLYPLESSATTSVAIGGTSELVVNYANSVTNTTEVLPPAEIVGVTDQGAGVSTVTVSDLSGINVGDVVVSGITPETPYGMLATVTSVNGPDGSVTVDSSNTQLSDAVPSGTIDTSILLTEEDAQPTSIAVPRGGQGLLAAQNAASPVGKALMKNWSCSATASASIQGSLSISPTVSMHVNWSAFSGVKNASITAQVDEIANVIAKVEGAGTCSLDKTALLAQPVRFSPIDIQVGPVPIVVVPELQFYLDGTGTLQASVTTQVTQHLTATGGLNYSQNGGLSPFSSVNNELTYLPPVPQAEAHVEAGVTPEISLLLYGIGGPSLGVRGALEFDANTSISPWWTVKARMSGYATLSVPKLNWNAGERELFNKSWVVAQATTPPPGSFPIMVNGPGSEAKIKEIGQTAVLTFQASQGDHLTVGSGKETLDEGVSPNYTLTVVDPVGQPVTSYCVPNCYSYKLVRFTAQRTGTYQINVTPGNDQTGGVTVFVSTPRQLSAGLNNVQIPMGTGDTAGREMSVQFNASAGDMVTEFISDTSNGWSTSSPVVLKPDGQAISPYATSGSKWVWKIPASGSYSFLYSPLYPGTMDSKIALNNATRTTTSLNGSPVTAVFDREGQASVTSYAATQGDHVTIAVDQLNLDGGNGYWRGEVFDSTGATIANLGNTYYYYLDHVTFDAPRTGTYTVVFTPGGTSTGTMRVSVSTPRHFSASLNGADVALNTGAHAAREIWVDFDASAGDYVSEFISAPSQFWSTGSPTLYNSENAAISLYSSNGTKWVWKIPASGSYHFVYAPAIARTMSSTISLNRATTASTSLNGAQATATIDRRGQASVITFTASQGDHLTFSVDQTNLDGGDGSYTGEIIDNAGNRVAGVGTSYWYYSNPITFDAARTGTYTVVFTAAGTLTGTLRLGVTTPRMFNASLNGAAVDIGTGDIAGREMWVNFDAQAGDVITPWLTNPDVKWSAGLQGVYASNGSGVPQALGGWKIPASGSYRAVYRPGTSAVMNATVALNRATTTSLVLNGASATATIDRPGQVALVTFTANNGDHLTLTGDQVNLAGGAGYWAGVVYDNLGNFVGSTCEGCGYWSNPLVATLSRTGTYTIVVQAGDLTGTVRLTATSP